MARQRCAKCGESPAVTRPLALPGLLPVFPDSNSVSESVSPLTILDDVTVKPFKLEEGGEAAPPRPGGSRCWRRAQVAAPLTGLAVLLLGILLTWPSGLGRAASLMGTQPCGT